MTSSLSGESDKKSYQAVFEILLKMSHFLSLEQENIIVTGLRKKISSRDSNKEKQQYFHDV